MKTKAYAKISHLLGVVPPKRNLLIGAGVFAIGEITATISFPLVTREIVDQFGVGLPIFELVALLSTVLVFRAITGALSRYLLAKAGHDVVKRLRKKIATNLIMQPLAEVEQFSKGELTSRIVNDTTAISNLFTVELINFVTGLLLLFGAAIVLFYLDEALTLLLFGVLTSAFAVIVPVSRKMKSVAKDTQDKTAALSGVLTQVFSEIRLVKSFVAEKSEVARCEREITALHDLGLRSAKISVSLAPIIQFAVTLSYIAIIGYGGLSVASGSLTVGTLTAFILFIFNVSTPMGQLTGCVSALQTARGASQRIMDILSCDTEAIDLGATKNAAKRDIYFNSVSYSYKSDRQQVLHGLNTVIHHGSRTAIVGASGSGKSTILALLGRLYEVEGGSILYGDTPINRFSLSSWRSSIGIVLQEAPVMPGTIRENMCYGMNREVSEAELVSAAKSAHCLEFIQKMDGGFETNLTEQGQNISGGQRQRIAIARVFLKNPDILILDEATSSLDSQTEYQISNALGKLMLGRTSIIVAHRLSTIKDAEKILVLKDGVFVGAGTHTELLENCDHYRDLVQQQFAV